MCCALMINILMIVFKVALVEGNEIYGDVCIKTEDRTCFWPDYFLHWSGMKCRYGTKGGFGECWPWFYWWMEVLYVVFVFPLIFGMVGIFCGSFCNGLCGNKDYSGGAIGCLVGVGIAWPCCSIPCLTCFLIGFFTIQIKCELCQQKMRAINCIGKEALSHRQECVKTNRLKYDNIPNSSLYSCKKCQKPLKLWPSKLLSKSSCNKCDLDEENLFIDNDGSNLHICFTCAATDGPNFHHLCSRHGKEGTITVVDWEDLETLAGLPKTHTFQTQSQGNQGRPLIGGQVSANVIPQPSANSMSQPSSNSHPQPSFNAMSQPPANAMSQPSANAMPPGWKVVTNPVTGEPYGLCNPSGEIKPLIDNKSSADSVIPPPLYDAAAPSQYSWNEKLNKEATHWKNKSQTMMRQTSIEMDAMATRFKLVD